jgi:transcription initiation factor IIE alpha subunit
MTKPQSPLTALERPRCPRCQVRMPLIGAERDLDGCDSRTFQCEKCGESLSMKTSDPMKSSSAGWLEGELRPPT